MQLPGSSKNWLSISGALVALFALVNIIMLFFVSLLLKENNPYIGIILFLIMPGILIAGLVLIPLGMWFSRKKEKMTIDEWPIVDLNNIKHRNAALIFIFGTIIFLFLSIFGGYGAFHFSESVEFCGTTCHSVMEPEYVAYQNSSHARVACVSCHVGDGAGWYVKSKLSGMYQVYAVLSNSYPKPIPTPIENLRPARETCETCHWPKKFYTKKLKQKVYYLSDDNNTKWTINMTMNIGGSHESNGLDKGIHWHVNQDTRVEYVATDDKLESIPWVRYSNLKTGEVKIFRDEENPITNEELRSLTIQSVDCMACHNRPSHKYLSPSAFINNAITAGDISSLIPEIKRVLTDLCSADYPTRDIAHQSIKNGIYSYYSQNYPELLESEKEDFPNISEAVLNVFDKNIFPEMGVRWNEYPAFIGHKESDGCFRCHNGTHISEDGSRIRRDCQLCHTIQAQGSDENWQSSQFGSPLSFTHPEDIDEAWDYMLCSECHTGENP